MTCHSRKGDSMKFMDERYKRDASMEISPDRSKKNLLQQTEGNFDALKVEALDNLSEYHEYDWDNSSCYKSHKKKSKKKKKKQKAKLLSQVENFQTYKNLTDERLSVLEVRTAALTEILALVVRGKTTLADKNVIHLNPEEYKDGER